MRDQIAPSKYQLFVWKRQSNVLHFCIFSVGKFCYYYYNIIWIKYNIPGFRHRCNSYKLFVLSKIKKRLTFLRAENSKLISTECHHSSPTHDAMTRWPMNIVEMQCVSIEHVSLVRLRLDHSWKKKKRYFSSAHTHQLQFNQFIDAHKFA